MLLQRRKEHGTRQMEPCLRTPPYSWGEGLITRMRQQLSQATITRQLTGELVVRLADRESIWTEPLPAPRLHSPATARR